VFLPDGGSSHVMVDEQLNSDHLCELMMKRRKVPMMTSWSIIEHLPELYMGTSYRITVVTFENNFQQIVCH